jgi:hypothetical protein
MGGNFFWGGVSEEHRGTEKLCEYKTVEQSLPMILRNEGKSKSGEFSGGQRTIELWKPEKFGDAELG